MRCYLYMGTWPCSSMLWWRNIMEKMCLCTHMLVTACQAAVLSFHIPWAPSCHWVSWLTCSHAPLRAHMLGIFPPLHPLTDMLLPSKHICWCLLNSLNWHVIFPCSPQCMEFTISNQKLRLDTLDQHVCAQYSDWISRKPKWSWATYNKAIEEAQKMESQLASWYLSRSLTHPINAASIKISLYEFLFVSISPG